ncbi:MAG: hypothetical protein C0423_14110 [Methylibium sp.]|nr:hypothetical protein [Methylibium sp.]
MSSMTLMRAQISRSFDYCWRVLVGLACASLPGCALGGAPADSERLRLIERAYWGSPQHTLVQMQAELTAAQRHGDAKRTFEAALRLGYLATNLAQLEVAQQAAAVVRRAPALASDPVALCLAAVLPDAQDDRQGKAAVSRLKHMLAQAREREEPWCEARTQAALGHLLKTHGRLPEAFQALIEALRLFRAEGNQAWTASVLASLAWLYAGQSDARESQLKSLQHGRGAVTIAERLGLHALVATAHQSLARPLLSLHRLDEADHHLAKAYDAAKAAGDKVWKAHILRMQAESAIARQQPELALALLQRAQLFFAVHGVSAMELATRLSKAEVLAQMQRWPELEHALEEADVLLERLDDPEAAQKFHGLAMRLHEARGRWHEALAEARALMAARSRFYTDQNRRLSAEMQARFEQASNEAEIEHLRDLEKSAMVQQRLLVLLLLLAVALIGALVWHGLGQRQLRRKLRELAERDELTGLHNRRAMLAHCQAQMSRGAPVTLALLDIDHFKSINDRFGHPCGDGALRAFAQACIQSVRQQDRVGRWGGEEFLIVLSGVDPQAPAHLFSRIRDRLSAQAMPGLPPELPLRFSMGASCRSSPEEDAERLLARADEALYAAKTAGRDRLMLAPLSSSQPPT